MVAGLKCRIPHAVKPDRDSALYCVKGAVYPTVVYHPPWVVSSEEQASYPTHMTSEQLEQAIRCTSFSISASSMVCCPPHRQSWVQT